MDKCTFFGLTNVDQRGSVFEINLFDLDTIRTNSSSLVQFLDVLRP